MISCCLKLTSSIILKKVFVIANLLVHMWKDLSPDDPLINHGNRHPDGEAWYSVTLPRKEGRFLCGKPLQTFSVLIWSRSRFSLLTKHGTCSVCHFSNARMHFCRFFWRSKFFQFIPLSPFLWSHLYKDFDATQLKRVTIIRSQLLFLKKLKMVLSEASAGIRYYIIRY